MSKWMFGLSENGANEREKRCFYHALSIFSDLPIELILRMGFDNNLQVTSIYLHHRVLHREKHVLEYSQNWANDHLPTATTIFEILIA